jgi:cell division protein FtsB
MKKAHNRNQKLLAFLGGMAVFLAIFQIVIFIFFSGQTGALGQMETEKETLLTENNRLEKEINQLTSLTVLEERAAVKGFTALSQENSFSSIIYLAEQLPLAAAN